MAMNRRTARILGAAAAGTAALVTLRELKKVRHRKEEERQAAIDAALVRNRDYGQQQKRPQKDTGFVDGEFSHIHFDAPPIHI